MARAKVIRERLREHDPRTADQVDTDTLVASAVAWYGRTDASQRSRTARQNAEPVHTGAARDEHGDAKRTRSSQFLALEPAPERVKKVVVVVSHRTSRHRDDENRASVLERQRERDAEIIARNTADALHRLAARHERDATAAASAAARRHTDYANRRRAGIIGRGGR